MKTALDDARDFAGAETKTKPLSILLVCNSRKNNAQTVMDHISSFSQFSKHTICMLSISGGIPHFLSFSNFDAIVIHYSTTLIGDEQINANIKNRIRDFSGLKVVFVQDEYRQVNLFKHELEKLGIDILFSCVPEAETAKVYGPEETRPYAVFQTLTGYVPESLKHITKPPTAERTIDVGYRSRQNSYALGELAQEKQWIADGFIQRARTTPLTFDISYFESDRLYGKKWIKFLSACKTVLGTESGGSVFDFTGEIEKSVEDYLKKNSHANFFEVREKFFAAEEGKIKLNQISPRVFEAICLKTALILFEGEYSNIIEPWVHFLPLKKDFSNFEIIYRKICDSDFLQNMSDRAFSDIACSDRYSYRQFISEFDSTIENVMKKKSCKPASRILPMRRFIWCRRIIKSLYFFLPKNIWHSLPNRLRENLRPLVSAIYPRVAKRK